jgi:hypothetical protein
MAEVVRWAPALPEFAPTLADAVAGVAAQKVEVRRVAMRAAAALVDAAPALVGERQCAALFAAARAALREGEKYGSELTDAAVALWCVVVRAAGAAVDGAELAAVMEEIPTENESTALVYQCRFVAYAAVRWPGEVTNVAECAWRLFRTQALVFEMFTQEEIAFYGAALRAAGEECIAEFRESSTEHGLRLVRERLAALPIV